MPKIDHLEQLSVLKSFVTEQIRLSQTFDQWSHFQGGPSSTTPSLRLCMRLWTGYGFIRKDGVSKQWWDGVASLTGLQLPQPWVPHQKLPPSVLNSFFTDTSPKALVQWWEELRDSPLGSRQPEDLTEIFLTEWYAIPAWRGETEYWNNLFMMASITAPNWTEEDLFRHVSGPRIGGKSLATRGIKDEWLRVMTHWQPRSLPFTCELIFELSSPSLLMKIKLSRHASPIHGIFRWHLPLRVSQMGHPFALVEWRGITIGNTALSPSEATSLFNGFKGSVEQDYADQVFGQWLKRSVPIPASVLDPRIGSWWMVPQLAHPFLMDTANG